MNHGGSKDSPASRARLSCIDVAESLVTRTQPPPMFSSAQSESRCFMDTNAVYLSPQPLPCQLCSAFGFWWCSTASLAQIPSRRLANMCFLCCRIALPTPAGCHREAVVRPEFCLVRQTPFIATWNSQSLGCPTCQLQMFSAAHLNQYTAPRFLNLLPETQVLLLTCLSTKKI